MRDENPVRAPRVKLVIENTIYHPRFVVHPPQGNAEAGGHQPITEVRRRIMKPDEHHPVKGSRYPVVGDDGALCATTYIGSLSGTHYFDEVDKKAPVIRLDADELHSRVLWTVADMNGWLAQHPTQGEEK
jgi:hypothetical protein